MYKEQQIVIKLEVQEINGTSTNINRQWCPEYPHSLYTNSTDQ